MLAAVSCATRAGAFLKVVMTSGSDSGSSHTLSPSLLSMLQPSIASGLPLGPVKLWYADTYSTMRCLR